jgi:hypothetical protein
MRRAVLTLAILLVAAAPAAAQQDDEGCKDHPSFARVPNYYISGCDTEQPSSYEFDRPGGTVTVEGEYWKIDYWVRDPARQPTALQIIRNYWTQVAAKGGTKVLEKMDPDGGTLTAKMPGPKGTGSIWLQVHVTMDGEVYSLTIVQEPPAVKKQP